MIYIVIGFLWLSICLYIILGGADFGAGIVEMFTNKKPAIKPMRLCMNLLLLFGKPITCG